jgi:hypothetical protein
MNWWLVANHLKHGMMTVRPARAVAGVPDHSAQAAMGDMPHAEPAMAMNMGMGETPWPSVPVMTLLSFLVLAAGVAIAFPPRPL